MGGDTYHNMENRPRCEDFGTALLEAIQRITDGIKLNDNDLKPMDNLVKIPATQSTMYLLPTKVRYVVK